MIIYDLKCKNNHKFEGWFKDRSAFEEQKAQSLISCPVCGDYSAELVLSSVAIMGKDSHPCDKNSKEVSAVKSLHGIQEFIDKNFEDVGDRFAEVAVNMQRGNEETRNIKGITTKQEETLLAEEGIRFFKIPITKFNS